MRDGYDAELQLLSDVIHVCVVGVGALGRVDQHVLEVKPELAQFIRFLAFSALGMPGSQQRDVELFAAEDELLVDQLDFFLVSDVVSEQLQWFHGRHSLLC